MTETTSFADRIRERYPEGLTGIYAPGGTRTSFMLQHQRDMAKPGLIPDFADYADASLNPLFEQIESYFELGGQNLMVNAFSYQGFSERGSDYAEKAAPLCLHLISDSKLAFYRNHEIDPYFVGTDTLLHLPEDHFAHQLGVEFENFRQNWVYQEGRRKVIWEIAAIPLFSFWRAHQVMGAEAQAEFEADLEQSNDLTDMHDLLYRYYARAVYGTDIPMPHFYLGSNRNGELKLRSMLPISMVCGGPFRMFFTPYPSLFMNRQTLKIMLEDLAFGKPLRSTKTDYSGQITPELIELEYQRVAELSNDPETTLGLVRNFQADSNR